MSNQLTSDSSCVGGAIKYRFCAQCLSVVLDPKNESALMGELTNIVAKNLEQISVLGISGSDYPLVGDALCPCCFGCISYESLKTLCNSLMQAANEYNMNINPVALNIIIPPILDTVRLTAKTVVARSTTKGFSFPNFGDLLHRVLKAKFSSQIQIVEPQRARYEITLKACVPNQLEYCSAMAGHEFKEKKLKRKFGFGGVVLSGPEEPAVEEDGNAASTDLNRATTDMLLSAFKGYSEGEVDALAGRMQAYVQSLGSQPQVTWDVSVRTCPMYLFGRYRKLARDVPQAPWTISVPTTGSSSSSSGAQAASSTSSDPQNDAAEPVDALISPNEDDQPPSSSSSSSSQQRRKGRKSVEEIISHAVCAVLGASDCRLHACGREDIDVRCLGNGRPFALEVNNAKVLPTAALLAEIVRSVNAREGLNTQGDLELHGAMTESDRSLWEGMQEKAEEKRKGYACVVWTADGVTEEKLSQLEALCTSGECRDEDGVPCIEIAQKTPLRVLHRRSLLNRKRYIYNVQTARINDHYFLMRLVTSAGAYVKEFVHGDLGRTVPSVSSVMNCQADILQLDVVWLYDDFEGGGEDTSEGNFISASSECNANQQMHVKPSSTATADVPVVSDVGSSVDGNMWVQWSDMRRLRLPRYKEDTPNKV